MARISLDRGEIIGKKKKTPSPELWMRKKGEGEADLLPYCLMFESQDLISSRMNIYRERDIYRERYLCIFKNHDPNTEKIDLCHI